VGESLLKDPAEGLTSPPSTFSRVDCTCVFVSVSVCKRVCVSVCVWWGRYVQITACLGK